MCVYKASNCCFAFAMNLDFSCKAFRKITKFLEGLLRPIMYDTGYLCRTLTLKYC